jgi:predicted AAA+ superfamily ATPase
MIQRPDYLEILKSFKNKNVIKVITGIRRSGKSTLLELFQEELLSVGVKKKNIISMNFEDFEYDYIENYKDLYNMVITKIDPNEMNYVFLDEVQRVKDFEKACDSLYIKKNIDLYITGSNAYLLSGELATYLSGRYIEIKMMPLSFKEYITAVGSAELETKYFDYILNSSFPYTIELDNKRERRFYLEGIFNSIFLKDVASRKPTIDIPMLQSLVKFIFDNIGNLSTSTKIADTMTSSGRKISVPTVESYIDLLLQSFLIYKTERYDIKGKQYLASGYKYYVCDMGLRYYLLGEKKVDRGHILENVVYLELIRRGYEVYVGKLGENEIDFITINQDGEQSYYQVAYTLEDSDGSILERELKPLNNIADHNSKYLLTMDKSPIVSHNGIKQIYVLDWLLDI